MKLTLTTFVNILTNCGVAGIWLLCFMSGLIFTKGHVDDLKDEITAEKEARRLAEDRADAERRRADIAVEAANTANILLAGIRKGIERAN